MAMQPAAMPQPGFGEPMHLCPRCGYRGMSAGYFSRGGHVAALVGITMLTMPIMGAGGLGFYLLRHNHRVCPRCGMHWGPHALRAMMLAPGGGTAMQTNEPAFPVVGSGRKGWAIALLIFAGICFAVGLSEAAFGVLLVGLLAGGGAAALLKGEKTERERRREAIIQSLQLPVLQLAGRKGGRLTVTDVATEMGWPMVRAEKVLNSLDDGLRVMSDITDEGVIVYDFVEIRTARLGRGGSERSALHA
jgi:ribosomal protein S27AE